MSSVSEPEAVQLPSELGRLTSLIDEKPESFASGDKDILDAALTAAKYIFDLTLKSESRAQPHLAELLKSIEPTNAPQTRAQARAAAQAGTQPPSVSHAILDPTPLSALFVDGMEDEQIWAQLELKAKSVCATLEDAFDAGNMDARGMRELEDENENEDEDDSEKMEGLEDIVGLEGIDADGQDWEMDDSEDEDEDEDEDDEDEDNEENLEEGITELRDPSSEEDEDEDAVVDLDAAGPSSRRTPARKFRGTRHTELDDDFFNLAEFNVEIEEAESKSVTRGALSKDSDEEDEEDEEAVDLFAPVDDAVVLNEDMDEAGEEAYYKDFFESPSRLAPKTKRKHLSSLSQPKSSKVRFNDQVKVKPIKSKGKGLPLSNVDLWTREKKKDVDGDEEDKLEDDFAFNDEDSGDEDGEESESDGESEGLDEGREAIERLKDDLFADDGNASQTGLSTHEARMAALREQIAELEAENVGEKDWVLKGEATSRSRPQNALLEEDLEFERVTKAVPVITDEVVQDLETRIKARIQEGRFDDVARKRAVDDKPFLPSRMFELQDTKAKESLAQIYENEYLEAQTGGTIDDRDGKLRKEHEEIEKLWEGICYKLDALCNARFTPKQPKATISTMSNVPAVALESALPTAKAVSAILAPEEVFAPSSSDLHAKSELTPAEKRALRTKERKKKKKQRDVLDKSVDKFAKMKGLKGAKKQKEEMLRSIVKNGKGVTVIGKKSQDLKKGKKTSKS